MSTRAVYQFVEVEGEQLLRINLPWGYVLCGAPGKNGLTIVNEMAGDPPELRYVSPDGGLGKLSFCMGADPMTAVELAMFQGKLDERLRDGGRKDLGWGEVTGHVRGPRQNPDDPRDDGMRAVALLLHDYVWFKGINGDAPQKPVVDLTQYPQNDEPPAPPVPPDVPLIDAQEQAERVLDVQAAREEFAPMELDDGKVTAFLIGRSSLREFHNDNVDRAGEHKPEFHRPGRPY